jgi:hypothetical protein
MPTALRIGPYRFFFYAGDRDELPHVHVERIIKWQSSGFSRSDCKAIEGFAAQSSDAFKKSSVTVNKN